MTSTGTPHFEPLVLQGSFSVIISLDHEEMILLNLKPSTDGTKLEWMNPDGQASIEHVYIAGCLWSNWELVHNAEVDELVDDRCQIRIEWEE